LAFLPPSISSLPASSTATYSASASTSPSSAFPLPAPNISGGLDANASIGPVQLRDLRIGVTYNPSHEEQTRITGNAELYIPAEAGLRLSVRGGIGAGLLIVSATGFLEAGATLGITGFARAAVRVDWSPQSGLAIDAVGELAARPSFTFDLSAGVVVELSLLFTSITLYERRWNLARFNYGSDLEFGVRFPIRYREGQPFEISLSDLEFRAPRIDVRELLTGLVRRFA
jgi:hypothetical protein